MQTTRPILTLCALRLGVAALLLALAFGGTSRILAQRDVVFAFNDNNIEQALSPTFSLPEAFRRVWNNQMFFGQGGGQSPIIAVHILQTLLGPHAYRREGVVLVIWFAGLAGYWVCRQFSRSRLAALFGGLLMMLCGWSFTFPAAGLPTRTLTLIFAALSAGWMQRGVTRRPWWSDVIAGGFLGLAVSETADVGMLFALCLAVLYLTRHFRTRADFAPRAAGVKLARFAVVVIASLLLAAQAMLGQFRSNIAGVTQGAQETPEARYAWATQWSLPKAETWSLFASDFHGASSRSETSPYWGGMGRTEGWEQHRQGFRNFRLAGYAVGAAPLALLAILGAYLFVSRRQEDDLLTCPERRDAGWFALLALVTLMLSWGKHFPLYRLFYALPYMDTIRNPDKWLGPFTLFIMLAAAMGFDVLRELATKRETPLARRTFWLSAGALAVPVIIALGSLIYLATARGAFLGELRGAGYGQPQADMALRNAVHADIGLLVALVVVTALAGLLLLRRRPFSLPVAGLLLAGVFAVTAVELERAGQPYMIGHRYRHILQSNPLTDWLDAHAAEGRIKLLPPQQPLLNNWRMTYLMAKGYDMYDPVSISRMPTDYQAFFDATGNVLRQWQLGSVRYLLTLAQAVPELQRMAPGRMVERLAFGVQQTGTGEWVPSTDVPPEQRVLRIVEYTDALPMLRFAPSWQVYPDTPEGDQAVLTALGAADFEPGEAVLLQGESPSPGWGDVGTIEVEQVSPTEARATVSLSTDGVIVRAVRYHPDWQITVDGQPARLLRADYLFQAVHLSPGRHVLHFRYMPSSSPLTFAASGRAAWFLILVLVSIMFRKP